MIEKGLLKGQSNQPEVASAILSEKRRGLGTQEGKERANMKESKNKNTL